MQVCVHKLKYEVEIKVVGCPDGYSVAVPHSRGRRMPVWAWFDEVGVAYYY